MKKHGLADQVSLLDLFSDLPKRNLPREVRRIFETTDIEAQCADFMRTFRLQLGLADDEELWPQAKDIRTLWLYLTVHNAYQTVLLPKCVSGQKPQPNDTPDLLHIWFAAYADVFVTGDSNQLEVAKLCLPPQTQTLSFKEFARQASKSSA